MPYVLDTDTITALQHNHPAKVEGELRHAEALDHSGCFPYLCGAEALVNQRGQASQVGIYSLPVV